MCGISVDRENSGMSFLFSILKKKKFGIVKRVISDNIVKRPMTMTKPSDTCYEAQAVYFTEGGSCTKALIK